MCATTSKTDPTVYPLDQRVSVLPTGGLFGEMPYLPRGRVISGPKLNAAGEVEYRVRLDTGEVITVEADLLLPTIEDEGEWTGWDYIMAGIIGLFLVFAVAAIF